ncbi:centrosome-associated protein 350-like isoform X4 [Pomacea canaliculata]|uniref:centrosome-associated protein 350-like isoform X4 n=1 Tax=Pomacea canaliculata TaxID=400727 RepID=UPI000D734AC2|nr:centrosome-associated protein 350-like isoform X4 [Pomacea canaliculata]
MKLTKQINGIKIYLEGAQSAASSEGDHPAADGRVGRQIALADKEQTTPAPSPPDVADAPATSEHADQTTDSHPADDTQAANEDMGTPKQQLPPTDHQEACCRYRWSKVVPTASARVIFFSSAKTKDPVFLIWSEEGSAYFSEEMRAPCGEFTGHVIVEGKTYPVEEYSIRSYTFEVDLFIKDDVIDDEVAASRSVVEEAKLQQLQQCKPPSVDIYHDITTSALIAHTAMEVTVDGDEAGIKHNTRYEDLIMQQKSALDTSLEKELAVLHKSDFSQNSTSTKRLTPVGDIDKELYHDEFSSTLDRSGSLFEREHSVHSSARHSPHKSYLTEFQQEYEADKLLTKSDRSSSRQSLLDPSVSGDFGMNHGSPAHGGESSGRSVPMRDLLGDEYVASLDLQKSPARVTNSLVHQSPLASRSSSQNSRTRTPVDSRVEDVLGVSTSSLLRQTPMHEAVGDVLDSKTIPASPVRPSTSSSARQTPERQPGYASQGRQPSERDQDLSSSILRSSYSPTRGMTQSSTGILQASQERLYTAQNPSPSGDRSRHISLSSSHPPSQCGSRTQSLNSLSSEQELSQFFNHSVSSEPRSTPDLFPVHTDDPMTLPPVMRGRDWPFSPSQSSPSGVDKRSFTPNTLPQPASHVTQQAPPFAGRTSRASVTSSRPSSRTVTPVPGLQENGGREVGGGVQDVGKVRDLEETVATLRKLLSNREQEAHELMAQIRDLREINNCLKQDLEHARNRRTPYGHEEQLERQLQQVRREKEVLAAEVVKLQERLEDRGVTSGGAVTSRSNRKIDDLEARVRELKEANQSTVEKLMNAELRIKELLKEKEIESLRSSSQHIHGLQNDRAGIHGDRQVLIEIQQLKEDIRTLRERNYYLQEENLKLKEKKEKSHKENLRVNFSTDTLLPPKGHLTSGHRSDEKSLTAPSNIPNGHLSDHRVTLTASSNIPKGHLPDHRVTISSRPFIPTAEKFASLHSQEDLKMRERKAGLDNYLPPSREPAKRQPDETYESDYKAVKSAPYTNSRDERKASSTDMHSRYREFSDRTDLQRPDSSKYDMVHTDRSRPDGEVSERKMSSKSDKYWQPGEQLRFSNPERDHKDNKVWMSAERLRILEEAELDRQKRVLAAGSRGQAPLSSEDPINTQDNHKWKKGEITLSDDSDSTAVLMSYDGTANPLSGQREKVRSSYREHSNSQEMYSDQAYSRDKDSYKDYRDVPRSYKEVNGDDSDTPTEILLNAEPGMTSSQRLHRHRKSSVGSEGSFSSLSDPEDMLRRRSRSVDTKGKLSNSNYGRTTALRPTSSTDNLGPGKSVPVSAGFRSVVPQPLATQHNRGVLLQQQSTVPQAALASSFTQGLRPFAPSSPADIRPDDVVKFSRQGGKLSQGIVKFVGKLPGRSDVYLGVELYKEEGKHDGTFEGVRYFKCKQNKGVFVAFNKVVMAWAPS